MSDSNTGCLSGHEDISRPNTSAGFVAEQRDKTTFRSVAVRAYIHIYTMSEITRIMAQLSHNIHSHNKISGLVVGRPTAVREDPGSNLTTAGRVYHDSHCDIQPWARVVHPYCSA